jgi:WD40 repeat protein/serine/threonine protein kinase
MAQPSDSEIVANLAEDFVESYRQGKRPRIDDYVRDHPHLADEIRDLFPTLLVVEDLAPDQDGSIDGCGAGHLLPPTTLESLGDFRILREIGRGGMGIVYEAEQVSLGRRVALKVLPLQQMPNKKHQARFRREARAAANLHHTNIVPVFGVGEEAGTSYYVMQLIQGVGLDELINELRRLCKSGSLTKTTVADDEHAFEGATLPQNSQLALSLWRGTLKHTDSSKTGARSSAPPKIGYAIQDESSGSFSLSHASIPGIDARSDSRLSRRSTYWDSVARIGVQIANAIQYAHEHSIIHRDIKPSNLLLDQSGTVWVTDFGLARLLDQQDISKTGDIVGTLRYMPPEAFTSKPADHRGDVYSLGISLYELLALRPAYEESDRHRLIAQLTAGPPERLERIDATIPRDLVTIVHKASEHEPTHRYQSAQALADDLTRFVNGEPISARRVSTLERVIRWSQRNKAMTAAIGSIAALLVVIAVVSSIQAVRLSIQKDRAEYARTVANIQSTVLHIRGRSTAHARRILRSIPAKHRNWEWAHLADKAWPNFATAHTQPAIEDKPAESTAELWNQKVAVVDQEIVSTSSGIRSGEFTSDGANVVLSSLDGSMQLYSLASGELLKRYVNPDKEATTSYGPFSPNEKKLLFAPLSGWPLIVEVSDTEGRVQRFRSNSDPLSLATIWVWSPDQHYIASAHYDHQVRFWNVSNLELDGGLPDMGGEVRNLYFDESGRVLWTASMDGTIRKWSFPQGEALNDWTLPNGTSTNIRKCPVTEGLLFQVVSPDRRRAVATFVDGSSFVWDLETGDREVSLTDPDATTDMNSKRRVSAVFSRDGTAVAIIRGLFEVSIHNVNSGAEICRIKDHPFPLFSIRFSPDGKRLMAAGDGASAFIWKPQFALPGSGRSLSNAHDDAVYQIAVDPSGRRLLSASYDETVRVWDLKTRRNISTYEGHDAEVIAVDWHRDRDGGRAASLDRNGNLHVWRVRDGTPLFTIEPESDRFATLMDRTGGGRGGEIFSFPAVLSTGLFSPDCMHLVLFRKDGMKVFDARNGELRMHLEGSNRPGWAVYSHDSRLVSVLEMDCNTPRVWDLHTGQLVTELKGHRYAITMISFSPNDDRIVTGGMAQAIIWNARTGQALPLPGGAGYVGSCRFSSDGRYVITGHSDSISRVWDSRTGVLLTELRGHGGRIRDVRMSPDETRFVSWATDNQVIVWDTERPSANPLFTGQGASRLLQAHWTPDGRDIVTTWTDGSIEILSGATKEDLSHFHSEEIDFEDQFDAWRSHLMTTLER